MEINTKNGIFYIDTKENTIKGGFMGNTPIYYDSLNIEERKVVRGVTTFILPPILAVSSCVLGGAL